MKVACKIVCKNTVIEFELFEDCSDIVCVIADNLEDDFVDNIFVFCTEDRRSLFLEGRSSHHSKF